MKWATWFAALCSLASGCSLVGTATHNVALETRQYLDTRAEQVRNRRWAEQAWEEQRQSFEPGTYSDDYADGFRAGFADYLFAGGTGEPPYLPPKRYWTPRFQTPEGYGAVQGWFAGFRHGASVARDGGYREWVMLPSPLQPLPDRPRQLDSGVELPAMPVPIAPSEEAVQPWVQAELVWPIHCSLSIEPETPPHGGTSRGRGE
jgi:hypothetical protein